MSSVDSGKSNRGGPKGFRPLEGGVWATSS